MSDLNPSDPEQVLEYVETTLTEIDKLQTENAELKQANQQLQAANSTLEADKVQLEKVASEKPDFKFEKELVDKTLDKLASMSYISSDDKEQIGNILSDDPKTVFGLITKIAETAILSPAGLSIDKISDSQLNDSDPFGWFDAVKPSNS
jgi:hypothetical protein